MEDVEISGNASQGQSPGLNFVTSPGEVSITDSLFTDNSPSDVVGCDSTFGADASFTWDETSGLLCE